MLHSAQKISAGKRILFSLHSLHDHGCGFWGRRAVKHSVPHPTCEGTQCVPKKTKKKCISNISFPLKGILIDEILDCNYLINCPHPF